MALSIGRTVGELLESISFRELRRWMEFDAFEPIGARRHDFNTALLMTQNANMHRNEKTRPQPYAFSDFMFLEKMRTARASKQTAAGSERAVASSDTIVFLIAKAAESGHAVKLS